MGKERNKRSLALIYRVKRCCAAFNPRCFGMASKGAAL